MVAVRARVAEARVRDGQAILWADAGAGERLVITIAPPVVGPRAKELADMYRGREVRAVGTVSDLGGALELLIGDPAKIRLADATRESGLGSPVAAVSAVTTGVPARSAATEVAAATAPACGAARRAWRRAADAARAPVRDLLGCLGGDRPLCTPAATRARLAMAEVAASEERLRWACGEGS